jgi:hypothetical protein
LLEFDEFEEMDKEEEEADTYVPGLLDDPEMVQGRHRTVMIGYVIIIAIIIIEFGGTVTMSSKFHFHSL